MEEKLLFNIQMKIHFKIFVFIIFMCMCAYVCRWRMEEDNWPLGVGVTSGVQQPIWVLGTKLKSF